MKIVYSEDSEVVATRGIITRQLTHHRNRRRYWLLAFIASLLFFTPSLAPVQMQGASPAFSNLTFSTSSTGPALSFFPQGTPEVFARWNYYAVPPSGVTLLRQWFRDGGVYIQKQEAWNYGLWGSSGTLNTISIFDRINGLPVGNYHVVISLMTDAPLAQVSGDFVITNAYLDGPTLPISLTDTQPAFHGLSMSTSAGGPLLTVFPAGTKVVNARWDYENIPIGASLRREWYLNGVLFRQVEEPWSAAWGPTGTLTHIAIYDYDNGLESGDYRLVVSLPDYPTVRAEVTFTIGPVPANRIFYNLTFASVPGDVATARFPHGLMRVYARWDFQNVPNGAVVVRRWYRNGVLFIEKQEPWTLGFNGTTTQDFSIYDFTNGLSSGDYYVEMSLLGVPNSLVTGSFWIM